MNPYFLMVLLYTVAALMIALASSVISFEIIPWFNGMRWLRVHLITLGILAQAAFGLLPLLTAARLKAPRPETRWEIWLTLNTGLIMLLIGIPLINQALIFLGGTLIFIAVLLLMQQLRGISGPATLPLSTGEGRPFYLMGLLYLLLGILIGTGLWLGWSGPLHIAVPIEAHIHANNWGFMALLFAGMIVDIYPGLTGRELAWPNAVRPIFWLMTLGALGLVLGPWFSSWLFTVPGILLYLGGTIWLLLSIVKPLIGSNYRWTAGLWHVVSANLWIITPVMMAPFILLAVPGFPAAVIEGTAPQALIYGWVLQFGYAVIPYLFSRLLLPNRPAQLGGNGFSLLTVHLGAALLWASIFLPEVRDSLQGAAYALWALSMIPMVRSLWHIGREGLAQLDAQQPPFTLAPDQ